MTHVTSRLTTKNRDQLRNPTFGNRVLATFTFLLLIIMYVISEKKQSVIHFPTPLENTPHQLVKYQTFLSDWRFALYLHFPYFRFPSLQIRTWVFRTCVFHPCEMRCFVLAFSSTCVFSAPRLSSCLTVHYFTVSRRRNFCILTALHFSFLVFPVSFSSMWVCVPD